MLHLLAAMALDPAYATDPDFLAIGVATFGLWIMICAAMLALLDSKPVRASVAPSPPSNGWFQNLHCHAIFLAGSAVFVVALAMGSTSGWYALVLWLLLIGVRKLRRVNAHAA